MTAEEILALHDRLLQPSPEAAAAPAATTPEALLAWHDRAAAAPRWQLAPSRVTDAELIARDRPFLTPTPGMYGPAPVDQLAPAATEGGPRTPGSVDAVQAARANVPPFGVDPQAWSVGQMTPAEQERWATDTLKHTAATAIRGGASLAGGVVAGPLGATGAGLAANYATDALGLTTPQPPIGGVPGLTIDNLLAALPLVPPLVRGLAGQTSAAKALTQADVDTAAMHAAADLKDAAAGKAFNAAQADYAGKRLMLRHETVQANEAKQAAFEAKQAKAVADADAATAAQDALYTAQGTEAYQDALTKAQETQHTYHLSKTAYDDAVTGQGAAVARARELAAGMKPETPAWVHYQHLADVAAKAPVDIDEVKALGRTLAGEVTSPQTAMPSRLQTILGDLDAQPSTISLGQLHENYMKELGPLTRSPDGPTRRVAKQMLGSMQDAMETSAGLSEDTQAALPLLQQAKATARREFAQQDLEEMVQATSGIDKNGHRVLRPGALAKRVEDAIENRGGKHPLFKGSFSPEELTQLHREVMSLTGTPSIPARAPTAPALQPGSLPLKDLGVKPEPVLPKDVGAPPVPDDPRLLADLTYGGPPPPPAPVERVAVAPALGHFQLSRLAKDYFGFMPTVVGAAAFPIDAADRLISKALMTPRGRALLKTMMSDEGRVSADALATGLAAAR